MPKTPEEPPKRPRGRPVTGRPLKRNKTLRLAPDVAEYLDTVPNQAETVEAAVRSTKEFKSKSRGKP
jgi:hypothetical protein